MRLLAVFLLLTFLISWTCFFGAAAIAPPGASMATGIAGAIYLAGVFAPALVALGLTAYTTGRGGVVALARRMVFVPRGFHWYLFALGYMPGVKLAAAVVHRVIMGGWPAFGETPWYLLMLAIPFSTPVQSGEELGWRGFALPGLARRFGLAWASLSLGAIWALWHLPFFFIAGVDKTGQSFPIYTLQTTAISVAMAWLYWRTGGSLLMTMLMHAAINNLTGIMPTAAAGATSPFSMQVPVVAFLTVGMMWIVAAWCLWQMRGAGEGEFTSEPASVEQRYNARRHGVSKPVP